MKKTFPKKSEKQKFVTEKKIMGWKKSFFKKNCYDNFYF
jgi:hypothetical protein